MADGAKENIRSLQQDHTPSAIRSRLESGFQHSYLRDFVYGAIDGTVTTFAIVSGVAGAGLSSSIVIILGVANLIGDGFSMAVSNFLGTRAEEQFREKARKREEAHIATIPDGEREEIRQIFAAKGFADKDLEKVVKVITSNKEQWVNTMLQEEFGMSLNGPSPLRAALATFSAFILIGLVPLLAFVYQLCFHNLPVDPFLVSTLMTGLAFLAVGALKGHFVGHHWLLSGVETLIMGSCAAFLAYMVGVILKGIV